MRKKDKEIEGVVEWSHNGANESLLGVSTGLTRLALNPRALPPTKKTTSLLFSSHLLEAIIRLN